MRLLSALLSAYAPAAVAPAQPASLPCLRYEPDTVALSGRLRRLTFPGRPNYESVAAGDEPEPGFYLDLPGPICAAGGGDLPLGGSRHGVRRVQLVLDAAGYDRLRPLLGQRVTLRGTLFSSFTAHHHAPLLLRVLVPQERGSRAARGRTSPNQ